MKRLQLWACSAAMASTMIGAASALAGPAGTAFTYQGRLTQSGAPANGVYDFSFRLYASQNAPLWLGTPIALDDVNVQNGLFTVSLDFGDNFDGGERWLSVWVRPGAQSGSYTVLSPRQELTPAPYAITAASSEIAAPAGAP